VTWIVGDAVIVNAELAAAFDVQVLPESVQHPDAVGDDRLARLVAFSPTGAGWEMAKGTRSAMLRRLDGIRALVGDDVDVDRFFSGDPIVPLDDPDGGRRGD
jgi:hypothetical protein